MMSNPKTVSDFTRYLINSRKLSDADLYKIIDLAQEFLNETKEEKE